MIMKVIIDGDRNKIMKSLCDSECTIIDMKPMDEEDFFNPHRLLP